MSRMWTGPAYNVAPSRSCDHHAPNSCPTCDGTAAEEREFWRASQAERRAALRDLAAWRSRRDNWATTRTDDEEATA